jgi:galactose mutarotase-like enzyme
VSEPVTIRSLALTAKIDSLGAELVSLQDAAGAEYLSDGDPAFWTGRAPLLFPIVGALNRDTLRHQGVEYGLEKHGFARRNVFEVIEHDEHRVLFRLRDSEETRTLYPFGFELDMLFALTGQSLRMVATVRNPGDQPLPFSFGYHPAFAWPLPGGGEKLAHQFRFEKEEGAPIRRLDQNGLVARREQSPVVDRVLTLHPDLFEDDAIIIDDLASSALSYQSPEGPRLEVAFENLPMLGIWQKPGAAYICIEPWAGIADAAGFEGEFADKRGVMSLPAGDARQFTMDVTVHPG